MNNRIKDNDHQIDKAAVWVAEGQSSQRDMLASLQTLKMTTDIPFTVIASHRQDRPEIFEFADKVYYEPTGKIDHRDFQAASEIAIPRWQFVLDHAKKNNVKVLLTGRNGTDYEAQRDQFSAAGIRLLTGATSVSALESINDKFAFMQQCHAHAIPVAECWRFDNIDELNALLAEHDHQPLCVKPVIGIFAQGFWRLDTGMDDSERSHWDSFEHLYFTEDKKISTEQFINAYTSSKMIQEQPIPMLLMPYLSGQEYSIDVVCEYGEVLAAITRYKTGKIQHIGYDKTVMDVVKPLIKAFGCDGIISVQTKADDNGQHRVLEINSRPAGGIGYTTHSGVDLTQVGFAYWLGLIDKPNLNDIAEQIIPCQVRSIMTSVKIGEESAH
ncbi:ATP-grasp domain-containing protein [Psychrobacter sp. CAL346-MNA-CIBAN-0220]|uniref:ATP-grasp domain-containing protein n=1 Tax=Psychrobacter sp. CAL346-MNA-CIBAN-0220 TaxID=3140457 RepID=UPI00332FB62E